MRDATLRTVAVASAATSGGGIYGGVISIVNSTVSGNSAGTSGGGIYNVDCVASR